MMDPRLLYTIDAAVLADLRGPATRPVLLHLLEGYVDAGQVTHRTSQHLRDACSPTELVRFDHDQLHDYRSRRPQMVFDTNQWVGLTDYDLALHRCTDAAGHRSCCWPGPSPTPSGTAPARPSSASPSSWTCRCSCRPRASRWGCRTRGPCW